LTLALYYTPFPLRACNHLNSEFQPKKFQNFSFLTASTLLHHYKDQLLNFIRPLIAIYYSVIYFISQIITIFRQSFLCVSKIGMSRHRIGHSEAHSCPERSHIEEDSTQ